MILLTFIIAYAILAAAAAGGARVIWVAIQPGELFDGWQYVLRKIEPKSKFWYKSLGGCVVCMRQRLAELSFAVFVALIVGFFGMWPPHTAAPNLGILTPVIRGAINVILAVNFCGFVLMIGEWTEKKKGEAPRKIEEQYPNEKIIRNRI